MEERTCTERLRGTTAHCCQNINCHWEIALLTNKFSVCLLSSIEKHTQTDKQNCGPIGHGHFTDREREDAETS